MTLDEIILARKSIRRYSPRPVPDELLNQVLDAGRLAPSARNAQTWRFTVVRGDTALAGLMEACAGQKMVGEAPAALVVWSEDDRVMACGQPAATVDCSIALSFMMLKATELGLGTCWLGHFSSEAVKDLLGLPQKASVVAVTPLGWPDETPAQRPRKSLEEIVDVKAKAVERHAV